AGSGNTITTDTEATITASSVTAHGGTNASGDNVALTATDSSSILAIAGAFGLSVKVGGGASGSVAVGLSVAASTITPTTLAEISGSSVTADGNIGVTATSVDGNPPQLSQPDGSTVDNASGGIHAYALGGAVAVSSGSATQVAGTIGG